MVISIYIIIYTTARFIRSHLFAPLSAKPICCRDTFWDGICDSSEVN